MTEMPFNLPAANQPKESAGAVRSSAGQDDMAADVDWRETLPAAEFCCWIVVALAPFLRWVNGAAVTDDQFYIQVGIVTIALTGALLLRFTNWKRSRRALSRSSELPDATTKAAASGNS